MKIKSVTEQKQDTYKLGDVFSNDTGFYMLCQIDPSVVCAICIESGNRKNDRKIKVSDCMAITIYEMNKLFACERFTKVNAEVTIS